MEARSRNHCCRGKVERITYCVCVLNYPAPKPILPITLSFLASRDLYSLPNIVRVVKSRRMSWAGHVACMGEGRGVHRALVGKKPEGKRPLGRPRPRWEDNIKMDLREVSFHVLEHEMFVLICCASFV